MFILYSSLAWILYSLSDVVLSLEFNASQGFLAALGVFGLYTGLLLKKWQLLIYAMSNGFLLYSSIAFLLGQPSYDWIEEIPFIIISAPAFIASIGFLLCFSPTPTERQAKTDVQI